MTVVELAESVAEMRTWQKKYFGGDKTTVGTCKRLERRIDKAVDAILNPPEPTLFDGQPVEQQPVEA